jgi:hypothetical protein
MATSDERPDDLRPEYDLKELRRVPGGRRRRREPLEHTSAFPADEAGGEARMKLSTAEAREFIARMDAALMPLFTKCVVPIYGDHNGVPIQCGTGTLFRVAGYSFLVSACHVTNLARRDVQLYISDAVPGARGIALEGNLHSENNLDVSVWHLAPQVVAELPNRQFLTIHHADRADLRVTRGWYYVHGYPNCWSDPRPDEQKTTVKAFTYGTTLYQGDTGTFEGYDPKLHVLLTAPKDGNVDSHGAETEIPASLKGISGSSIWQAYYEGLPSRSWTADDAVVVAVQTGVYRGGTVVRGTRWWIIEKILSKNYPGLAGPLSLMTPSMRKPSP